MFQFLVLVEVGLLLCFYLCSGNYASVASFSDDRCGADGVCSSDPLTFTCEINGVAVLQVVLPNGYLEIISHLHTREGLNEDLPDGFTAVTLDITEIDSSSRDFVLTLSITNASLLAGGEIRCDDTTDNNVAMAGCPVLASTTAPSNLRQLLSSNTPTNATITWDSVDAVSYNVNTSVQSPVTGIEEESYTLTDLELETDYTVSVTATNECGVESLPSQDITIRIDIQSPVAPTVAPLIGCSDNDETMALVEISWTYGDIRPTTASGLVDAPVTGVEVSYRDHDGSNKNACVGISDAVCSCDTMCTCGSVSVADTSCSLYLPLRDGLQYEEEDDIPVTVVVHVSNGKTTTESEIVLNAQLLEVRNDLDAVAPSMTLTLNQYCRNDYTVLITFGVRSDDDVCEEKLNVTREIQPNTPETIAVDTNAIKLENDQEYCFIGMTSSGSVMMMSDDEESESAGLSIGAAVGITLAITLLVALPVGVALGCCGTMWYMMRRGATSGQKVTQLQAAIYEEPVTPAVELVTIHLTDNQAYGHFNTHTNKRN